VKRKFDLIIEGVLRRFQGTNLLVGDRVKFTNSYLQHEWTKKQPSVKLERIKNLIESGDNIRVSAVKSIRPVTAQTGHFEAVDDFYVDIIREKAPGLFMPAEIFTVPQELLESQEDYPNLAGDTPESQIRKDTTNIKPEDVDVEDNELSPVKQTGTGKGDRALKDKNVDISNTAPAKSYTAEYIKK